MSVTTADQVTYPTGLSVATDGVTASYADGALLPAATSPADLATRMALREAGMVRHVTVVTTAEDLAAAELAAVPAADDSGHRPARRGRSRRPDRGQLLTCRGGTNPRAPADRYGTTSGAPVRQ